MIPSACENLTVAMEKVRHKNIHKGIAAFFVCGAPTDQLSPLDQLLNEIHIKYSFQLSHTEAKPRSLYL